ncbi:MAG: beta-N-acetylhexosaminidase [Pseudomonadota bacterium]
MSEAPRACILSVSGPDLLPGEARFLGSANPWGVILMGRSCVSRAQVRALVQQIWQALGRACLVFIDKEGGRVARLRGPEWPKFPAPSIFGEVYGRDTEAGLEAAYLSHRLMAQELADLSIHADCAPVLDLPVPGAHDVIGDRAFSSETLPTIALAGAAIQGLLDGGVAPVIKHLPGHGRARVDSHLELPRVSAGTNELVAKDFAPFEALNAAPMAMTAHIAFDNLDPSAPATLSEKVIGEVIRGRIGFEGLLMTDDLGMNALGGSLASRAQRALGAGCDVVLHCAGFTKAPAEILAEMEAVAEVCPRLEAESQSRAERAAAYTTRAKPFDSDAGWARLRVLVPDESAMA